MELTNMQVSFWEKSSKPQSFQTAIWEFMFRNNKSLKDRFQKIWIETNIDNDLDDESFLIGIRILMLI